MISACGLITPSLYSRLGEMVNRIRLIHHHKIELLQNHYQHNPKEMQMLLDMLDSQSEQITEKAKMIKTSLYCFLCAIAAFLFCSVFAGADELYEWVGTAALGAGVLGVGLFLAGLGWALRELSLALDPLQAEKEHLKVVTGIYLAKSTDGTILKASETL